MIAYTLQANLFALIVLMIVYQGAKKHTDLSRMRDRIFMILLWVNAIILVTDSFSIFLYDVPGMPVHVVQSMLKALFYILNPLPGLLWLLYVYDFLFHDWDGLVRLFYFSALPVVVNAVLAVASVWGGYLFMLSPENHYQRGSLFMLMPIFSFSYTLAAFVMIAVHRSRVQRQELWPLLSFSIPPILGGILQTAIYGLVVLWPSMTVSLLIIYVFIQSRNVDMDFLTGLNNRRAFDYRLEDWRKWHRANKRIAGFMMDLDRFKEINDTLGHQMGDKALVEMGRILRESFRRHDFLVRLGGDEFAAIIEVFEAEEVERVEARLQENVGLFNQAGRYGFELHVSCGYAVYDGEKDGTLGAFFDALDRRMYENKRQRKLARRREDTP